MSSCKRTTADPKISFRPHKSRPDRSELSDSPRNVVRTLFNSPGAPPSGHSPNPLPARPGPAMGHSVHSPRGSQSSVRLVRHSSDPSCVTTGYLINSPSGPLRTPPRAQQAPTRRTQPVSRKPAIIEQTVQSLTIEPSDENIARIYTLLDHYDRQIQKLQPEILKSQGDESQWWLEENFSKFGCPELRRLANRKVDINRTKHTKLMFKLAPLWNKKAALEKALKEISRPGIFGDEMLLVLKLLGKSD
jgi:hypothetical protein